MSQPPSDNDPASVEGESPSSEPPPCDDADCEGAVAELYGYLDGHLDDERRSLIKSHLDQCAPCFSAFDFETELRHVIAAKCKEKVPMHLRQKIQDALSQEA